jgi:dTDP-4-dehydrorhamnose reductase
VIAADRARLDVGDRDAVLGAITSLRPDLIVNAAAYTDVDGCERDPDRAYRDNAMAVRHLADGARQVGAHLVHVSTDYVFDGAKHAPYHEWDDTAPLSVYARSKLAGEWEAGPSHTVVRTSWVFSRHGRNFVQTVLDRAAAGGPLRIIDDQVGIPTAADDLARAIRLLAVARVPGVFHVSNAGETSRYEQARFILGAAGLDPDTVEPIKSADLDWLAVRPMATVLDNMALRLNGFPALAHHHEPLERTVKELTS